MIVITYERGDSVNKVKAFEDYIVNNIDSAYRFAYTYVKNSDDAQDIVNDSVTKALSSINTLKNTEYIKTWFYKIISNTAIDFLRKNARCSPVPDDEFLQISVDENGYRDVSFNSITDSLDVKYREIVVLRFLENMKISEIAKILSLNENTVKTRLYKALELLKIDMEDDEK